MAEAEAEDVFRCTWLEAESAAADTVVEVIDEAAAELYDHYLEDSSYPFACEVAADIFRARMGMAFVPFDEGEKNDADWLPEPPPERPPLDAWARSAVPVMKKREAKPSPVVSPAKEKSQPARKSVPSQPKADEVRQWSLAVDPEMDPDEEAVREVKARDDKRKQNEIQRQQKLKEESEAAAKAAKGRATEMEQKQFAFDSNGTVFFVQPVAPHTLPSPVTLPGYKFKGKDNIPPDPNMSSSSHMAAAPRGPPPKDRKDGRRKRKEPQFTDLFTKLSNQQPHTIDVIELAPGVVCSENGKNRSGPEKAPETLMTKAAYDEMVKQGEPMVTQPRATMKPDRGEALPEVKKVEAEEPPASLAAPEPPEPRRVPAPPQEYRTPKAAVDQDDFNASIIKESQWGENPGSPGKALNQARPPPITHSMKLKRDAIGNLGKVPRDRLVGLGSMGRRQPQPPLGAVMGHGLYGDGEAGEFYFPDGGASAGSPTSQGKTKKPPQGYEADAISHALNLHAQREKSGGTISTRRSDLVRSMLH